MTVGEASPLLYNQVIHIPSSDGVANVALTSGVALDVGIPVGSRAAAFAFNADIWVTFGTTAVGQAFSSYSSAGSTLAQELNPTIRYFGSTTTLTAISVFSDYTCRGSVSFYK